ncbi:hypothetical protein FACS1894216_01340 [Synergistales bacterium]|nr:hypothetical protein FACS1894216_01340 [Synergistales bacterium]
MSELLRNNKERVIVLPKGACFTQRADRIANVISSEVVVVDASSVDRSIPYGENKFKDFKCNAIWDTGATRTVITKKVIAALGLKEKGVQEVHTAGGTIETEDYVIDLWLPNQVSVNILPVIRGAISDEYDVLIGMDVIGIGDFCITNFQGKTTFSFRMPSMESIDFLSSRPTTGSQPG